MNREIRFRAWDKEHNEFIDWIEYMSLDGKPFQLWGKGEQLRGEDLSSRVILMQYTGLKDKNGKEIYEGDICKDSLGALAEIWWQTWKWEYAVIKGSMNCELDIYNKRVDFEVIGNIYENPELVKENK